MVLSVCYLQVLGVSDWAPFAGVAVSGAICCESSVWGIGVKRLV